MASGALVGVVPSSLATYKTERPSLQPIGKVRLVMSPEYAKGVSDALDLVTSLAGIHGVTVAAYWSDPDPYPTDAYYSAEQSEHKLSVLEQVAREIRQQLLGDVL